MTQAIVLTFAIDKKDNNRGFMMHCRCTLICKLALPKDCYMFLVHKACVN